MEQTNSKTSNKLDYKTNTGQTLGSLKSTADKALADERTKNAAVLNYQRANPTATAENNKTLRGLIKDREESAIKSQEAVKNYQRGAEEVDKKNLGKPNYSANADVNKQKQTQSGSKPTQSNTGGKPNFKRN